MSDRVYTEGFPERWSMVHRDDCTLLVRRSDMGMFVLPSQAICMAPKLMQGEAWLGTAKEIAHAMAGSRERELNQIFDEFCDSCGIGPPHDEQDRAEANIRSVRTWRCERCDHVNDRPKHRENPAPAENMADLEAQVAFTLSDASRLLRKQDVEGACPHTDDCFYEGDRVRCGPCAVKASAAKGIEIDDTHSHLPEVCRLRREVKATAACIAELAAKLIEDNVVLHTAAGKVLRPRQEGNQDGLYYATAIRALGTNHGYKSTLHPGNVPPAGDA